MNRFRNLLRWFLVFVFVFLAFHYLTWKIFTEKILSGRNYGDLARIAYRPDLKKIRHDHVDLPSRHIHIGNNVNDRVDVLTIGDSFSSGCGSGRNNFYQDYIATIHGKKVANVSLLGVEPINLSDPVQILLLFINSGVIDDIRPRVVILETSERLVYQRLAGRLDTGISLPREKIQNYCMDAAAVKSFNLPNLFFVNDGNLKFYYYTAKRWFETENPSIRLQEKLAGGYFIRDPAKRLTSEIVGQLPLSKPMFSGINGDTLLFTIDELLELPDNQRDTAVVVNANLNYIAQILESKNIRLYFMMIPDKINLYADFLRENPFKRSEIFELLETMDKKYTFVNTKKILINELEHGDPVDLFHADDTHWTWRASELVVKSMKFE